MGAGADTDATTYVYSKLKRMLDAMSTEEKIAAIDKKITWVKVAEMPGAALLGLGAYAKFGNDPATLHPLLGDASVVNGMLIVGVLSQVWGFYKLMGLFKEKNRLKRGNNTADNRVVKL